MSAAGSFISLDTSPTFLPPPPPARRFCLHKKSCRYDSVGRERREAPGGGGGGGTDTSLYERVSLSPRVLYMHGKSQAPPPVPDLKIKRIFVPSRLKVSA